MIVAYYRPKTIEEALPLLAQPGMDVRPMGGGSGLDRYAPEPFSVVDLQDLNLDALRKRGNYVDIGATVTLQRMLNTTYLPPALHQAIHHEATHNLRQVATVAGTLVNGGGRSPFTTAMLALDTTLTIRPGVNQSESETLELGELLPFRHLKLKGCLITQVTIPLNVGFAYTYVARTPADLPIVCVSVAMWPSGRTRVALGGFGPAPTLAMDGPDAAGVETAAREAYSQAGDEWASAEYRMEVAGVLARRGLEQVKQGRGDMGEG